MLDCMAFPGLDYVYTSVYLPTHSFAYLSSYNLYLEEDVMANLAISNVPVEEFSNRLNGINDKQSLFNIENRVSTRRAKAATIHG